MGVIVLCNNRNGAEWHLAGSLLRATLGLELTEPTHYPDFTVQKLLREQGPAPALAYLEKALVENKGDVSPYDLMLLAYRLIQGSGASNLETSKEILELLAEHFSEDPQVDSMPGEVYFRLAEKYYGSAIEKNPSDWASIQMLKQLEGIRLGFF